MSAISVITDLLIGEDKHKNATCLKYRTLKYRTFCCVNSSVQFLRPWKDVEKDNRHNMWDGFFIQLRISFSHMLTILFLCVSRVTKVRKFKNPAPFIGVQCTVTVH